MCHKSERGRERERETREGGRGQSHLVDGLTMNAEGSKKRAAITVTRKEQKMKSKAEKERERKRKKKYEKRNQE